MAVIHWNTLISRLLALWVAIPVEPAKPIAGFYVARSKSEIYADAAQRKNIGDKLNLELLRDGKIINAVITLEKRPES